MVISSHQVSDHGSCQALRSVAQLCCFEEATQMCNTTNQYLVRTSHQSHSLTSIVTQTPLLAQHLGGGLWEVMSNEVAEEWRRERAAMLWNQYETYTILMLAESLSLFCRCLSHDWDQVTIRTTRWRQGRLRTLSDDVVSRVWRPMLLLLTIPDDLSDDKNTTLTTLTTTGGLPWTINVTTCWRQSKFSWRHLTTPSGDIYCQSWTLPVCWHVFVLVYRFWDQILWFV